MAKRDTPFPEPDPRPNSQDSQRSNADPTGRARVSKRFKIRRAGWMSRVAWWRAIPISLALWWLAAKVGDTLLDFWWLRDAQRDGSAGTSSTWGVAGSVDFVAAHVRLEAWRWGSALVGALICGAWAWRQGRIAVEHARESEASLGALWSMDEAGTPVLAGLDGQQTGRWIPLEDKLALDRFRSGALRLCVGGAAIVGGVLGGRAWSVWLDFWHASEVGRREPWLGADLSFYLFRLPALDFAWRLLLVAQWMALALCLAIYLYEDALQVGRRLWASRRALKHIGAMLALLLAWKAVGALLFPFELLVSRSPLWSGPHAVDWNWRVPLNFAGALLALACAAACLREARSERPAIMLRWALAPVAASWILAGAIPSARQAVLSPAQAAREDEPFARAQADWTLLALGFRSASSHQSTPETTSRELAELAQQELALAPGAREMASWGQSASSPATGSLSLLPATAPSTSRAFRVPQMFWQQAEPRPLVSRVGHLQSDTRVLWKRFGLTPAATSNATSNTTSGAGAARLLEQDEGEMAVLCGLDSLASPGLLFDAEVMAAVASGDGSIQRDGVLARRISGEGRVANSFFATSFEQDARVRRQRDERSLPDFHLHNLVPPSTSTSSTSAEVLDEPSAGVALDARWKRMLAAWRLGSLSLATSPRLSDASRLSWRLDVAQRCRRLAPFVSWPGAPRPLRAPDGRLLWLMDGFTLSAAFPLARPLDTARAFSSAAASRTGRALGQPPRTSKSTATSEAASEAAGEAAPLPDTDDRQERAFQIWRREAILARIAAAFDGYNWARASVAALVDARTGQARLFALDEEDPILSLYRRALPEMWSPASALPGFARAALRPPPHLTALQSAAWAALLAPTSSQASPGSPNNSYGGSWSVRNLFFLASPRGLQTEARLASNAARPPTAAPSTWGPLDASHSVALASTSAPGQSLRWQARFQNDPNPAQPLAPLAPLDAAQSPPLWATRSTPRVQEPSSTWKPGASRLNSRNSRWQRARELFRESQSAREQSNWGRYEELSRELDALFKQAP